MNFSNLQDSARIAEYDFGGNRQMVGSKGVEDAGSFSIGGICRIDRQIIQQTIGFPGGKREHFAGEIVQNFEFALLHPTDDGAMVPGIQIAAENHRRIFFRINIIGDQVDAFLYLRDNKRENFAYI